MKIIEMTKNRLALRWFPWLEISILAVVTLAAAGLAWTSFSDDVVTLGCAALFGASLFLFVFWKVAGMTSLLLDRTTGEIVFRKAYIGGQTKAVYSLADLIGAEVQAGPEMDLFRPVLRFAEPSPVLCLPLFDYSNSNRPEHARGVVVIEQWLAASEAET